MKKLTHFLVYNNTIPLVFGVLFLGAGATFAASPEARSAVIQPQSELASVDNAYLLAATITKASASITVGAITENDTTYFVDYQLTTIDVKDGVWQPVTVLKTMVVNKEAIAGKDLGLYASEELSEVHTAEIRRLKETQESQRQAGATAKVVATEYRGLVGQFLNPTTEVFPGYVPLIDPAVGIPLTREQEAAERAEQRRIEELKAGVTVTTNNGTQVVIPPIGGQGTPDNPPDPTPPTEPPAPAPNPPAEITPTPDPAPAPDSAPTVIEPDPTPVL